MSLRIMFINTDYNEFLNDLYTNDPLLVKRSYEEQLKVRNDTLFGTADFCSRNMRKIGHEAWDIHANNEFMQKMWANERGIKLGPSKRLQFHLCKKVFPRFSFVRNEEWKYKVLEAQVDYYKPDILYNHDIWSIESDFLKRIKPKVRLLIGQHAAPFYKDQDLSCYDLLISSLPNLVEYFKKKGLPARLQLLAFEPEVLNTIKLEYKKIDLSFVGSLSRSHESRVKLIEYLCEEYKMQIWGRLDRIAENSPIRKYYMGEVYGAKMFQALGNSRITINSHIDIAEGYANNMRLFEATGVGALLVTDWKRNLQDIFISGKEVVSYRSKEECYDLIRYYLQNEDKRQEIALAGQKRTLNSHTYLQRMQELEEIIKRLL
ncbi:MAG: glycosyltransferase [Candidatus Omnitrophica bacterium]|nr:glycosyltransferase [Candidatus Omnitrophota bacterium]MBU1870178.1 glycosyltransferase [Candidatus Omnitrophota bacterium]